MASDQNHDSNDRQWGSFTEAGPWQVVRDEVSWLNLATTLRNQAQAEVPTLTKPSRLPPGARVVTVSAHLGRAIGPWMLRKRRRKYSSAESSRADIARRVRSLRKPSDQRT